MRRSPYAALSPTEFASLRRVANGLINTVPREHHDLFLNMGLAQLDGLDGLALTAHGQLRLEWEDRYPRRVAPAPNQGDRPE